MKVIDYNKYRRFDYENEPCETFQLGDVLYKDYDGEQTPEIGVVIQTFSDGDVRTDMWGMCSPSEVRLSSLNEVEKYRPDLFGDLIVEYDSIKLMVEKVKSDIDNFLSGHVDGEVIDDINGIITSNFRWYELKDK